MKYTRRDIVKMGAGAGAALGLGWRPTVAQTGELITKAIPSSGERVPVIGIGARNFRIAENWASDDVEYSATIKRFHELGGTVVDTSPNYGNSETVLGKILGDLGVRDDLWLATKVDREDAAAGITRMEESMEKLRTDRFQLMQVHNLRGWEAQLPTMREWKQEGKLKYIGITTSSARQYEQMEQIMRQEELDFIQVDFAVDNRGAADRILPLAADRGMGVLVNLPFGRGRLFQRVGERELPEWAAEFQCTSWAQFFLKYVASHPSVTAPIPGTTKPHHAEDNNMACRGRLPNPEERIRMEQLIDAMPDPPGRQRG